MKGKLSRREVIKVLAAAGAALAAAPYLPKALGSVQPQSVTLNTTSSATPNNEPLVIVVKDEELLAFRGIEEFRVLDARLASQLKETFQHGRVSD